MNTFSISVILINYVWGAELVAWLSRDFGIIFFFLYKKNYKQQY